MKIVLLGEYSRLHNSLKEGLVHFGHEVILVSTGDKFKNFPSDYSIYAKFTNRNSFFIFISKAIRKVFKIDFFKLERAIRFYFFIIKQNYCDHIQIINSDFMETYPFLSRFLYKKVLKKSKSCSLLVCGDETPIIDYFLKKELKYSILSSYSEVELQNKTNFSLKYSTASYRKTFDFLIKNTSVLIGSDLDYKIPLEAQNYKIAFIPNPINCDQIAYIPMEIPNVITIFLGINRLSFQKKGNYFFEKALAIIQDKYQEKIKICITENLPYSEFIKVYDEAHIVLDQVFAYDQGYNALEAMAKGKVVFTGAETPFLEYYNLVENQVCINALPNEFAIAKQLEVLIENPEKIIEISKNARNFIEKEHHYLKITEAYLKSWGF